MTLDHSIAGSRVVARPFQRGDEIAVLELIDVDRLPGQPSVTRQMLGEALAGRSTVDSGWWEELEPPRTELILTGDDTVGVLSTSRRPRDGAGLLLWSHTREDPVVTDAAVQHAVASLSGCAEVHAFDFASALTLGLEALPVRHRPVTDRALRDAGFTSRDLWRYAHRPLPAADQPRDAGAVVSRCADPPGWQLEVREPDGLVAEAVVGEPEHGIGVLWWISVEPRAQGRGLGRRLLGQALAVLSDAGAREVILYVDDDEPGGDRNRTAANRLYDAAGFREIDRLHSYTRISR